jgi:hypothetical protein
VAGSDEETTPPGWYRQQDDPTTLRWWDGDDWTDETMPAPSADRSRRRAEGTPGRPTSGEAPVPKAAPDTEVRERPARTIPIASGEPRSPAAPTRPSPADRDEDWAAGAWEAGAGPKRPERAPEAPRMRQPAAREEPPPRGPGPSTEAPRGRAPRPTDPARPAAGGGGPRPAGANRPPAGPRPDRRPDPRRDPRAAPRPGPRTGGAPSTAPRRRTDGAQTVRPGARRDERVVQRGGAAPPVVRVALRALLIAVLLGVGYLAYTQIRDAEPEHARTLPDGEVTEATVDDDLDRLDQVVLALGDLPRGWTAQAVGTELDDICDGRVPQSVVEPLETTKAAFTMGEAGPFITNVVSTFADDEAAQAFLDLTARTIESCRTYEVDGGTSIELGALEFPNFGDASFVAEAIGTSPYGDLAGDIIYVRVGQRVTSVETIAFGESTLSPELVEHLTRLVANRMD